MSADLNNPRLVRFSKVRGVFTVPMGLNLFGRDPGHLIKAVEVSTVCLEGGHKEAPVAGMLDPEHGFETMVFFEECSFFGVYQEHYETRAQAVRGHKAVVKKLLSGKLPLTIKLGYYNAWEEIVPQKDAA